MQRRAVPLQQLSYLVHMWTPSEGAQSDLRQHIWRYLIAGIRHTRKVAAILNTHFHHVQVMAVVVLALNLAKA